MPFFSVCRLWALSPNVPEFTVSWHSQVAQAVMHKAVGVTAVATAAAPGLVALRALSSALPCALAALAMRTAAR